MKRFLILILSAIMINVSMGPCFILGDCVTVDEIHKDGGFEKEGQSSTCKLCLSNCYIIFPPIISNTIKVINCNSFDFREQFFQQVYYPTLRQPPKFR